MSTPVVFHDIAALRAWRASRSSGDVGFVPTMGGLHEGHASLIRRSVKECQNTVVSIFVNPLQFGPNEDFARYPRTPEADLAVCEAAGADVVWMANRSEMYPGGFETHVEPGPLANVLCGASRPGHFRGVTTVVAKLFGVVQPNRAYFGRKDFQQVTIIQRMVVDLNMPVTVVVCPTVREPDGLAMSTRNQYLRGEDRVRAACLWKALGAARRCYAAGVRSVAELRQAAVEVVSGTTGTRVDYVEVVNPETLRTPGFAEQNTVLALAVHVGKSRLIDNGILSEPHVP